MGPIQQVSVSAAGVGVVGRAALGAAPSLVSDLPPQGEGGGKNNRPRSCARCQAPLVDVRAKFCGRRCRQATWRDANRQATAPKAGRVAFRPAWLFKGDAADRIAAILAAEPEGLVVHACCGESRLPREDVRVDLFHPSATLRCDVADLARHIQGAAVVVMDPPYGVPLPQRQRMLAGCLRALRPGGLLVLHAPWWPRFRVAQLELGATHGPFFREDWSLGWPHPPVILSCWRRRDTSVAPADAVQGDVSAVLA